MYNGFRENKFHNAFLYLFKRINSEASQIVVVCYKSIKHKDEVNLRIQSNYRIRQLDIYITYGMN